MGNSHLAARCHLPGETSSNPSAPGANGILGRIQGEYVSAAILTLPPAASSVKAHLEVEMDAGPNGRVRLFAE